MKTQFERPAGRPTGVTCTLAIMATCWSCHGAITYIDPDDIGIPTNFAGIYLDLNSPGSTTPSTEGESAESDSYTVSYSEPAPGTWDVNFFFGGAAMVHSDKINIYRGGGGTDNLSAIHGLEWGTTIDGGSAGGSQPLDTPDFGGSGASPAAPYMGVAPLQFTNGVDSYVGFVLDDGGGGSLYGWMLVELHDDGSQGFIKEWAYDSSPIYVGQIPEPSVPALVALALTGVALRRKRRA